MLDSWIADDTMSATDAQRIATAVGGGNARRVYGLDQRNFSSTAG
jgi:hypothetical protein